MLALKGRKDGFKFLFPKDFICDEIKEKYAKVLKDKHGFFVEPIDFLNESIIRLEVLGFNDAVIVQQNTGVGKPLLDQNRIIQNQFRHTSAETAFRSDVNPLQLIDKTINIEFRHTLGFLNYFMLFENFWYLYSRDMQYKDMLKDTFTVDIFNEIGEVYCKIEITGPIMNSMDMLSLDYSQPIAQSDTFKVTFKYTNLDFIFIQQD